MTDPRTLSEDDQALAAEYVLGTLPLPDRIAAEARIKADPAFAAEVARWEQEFAALNDGYAEIAAPDLMPKIEARLFGKPQQKPGWSRFWIIGAGLATAVAVLVALWLPTNNPFNDAPTLTAELTADAQPVAFAAQWSAGELELTQTAGPAAEPGRVYELWLIAGEAAPVSLGLIDDPESRRALADLPLGAVLAVSLEPTGGSPTGAPTGPVLVTGTVTSL